MFILRRSLVSLISFITITALVTHVQAQDTDYQQTKTLFAPLPARALCVTNPLTDEKIALGKKLYSEKRLSLAKDISCNSCHGLSTFGVDNRRASEGDKKQLGGRNSPSVYNAALHFVQFWDGRAKDVEEQALGPIQNPVEMAMPKGGAEVVARLRLDPSYATAFEKAFPAEKEPITFENVGKAIGAFERTLITPSRFDDYLNGNRTALTPAELKGLQTFKQVSCTACHNGVTIGGQMYQKIGLVKPYETKDLGRYEVTKNEADKYLFKVPSLRNIEKTAPYFHDGSVATLDQAITLMGKHQLGKDLSSQEVQQIATFLKSLTGKLPVE